MMTGRIVPILLVLGIVCATCAWAQNDAGTADTGAPTQPGPKPAFTYPDATPSLDFLNQAIENSSITLGIGSGFAYTSYGYGGAAKSASGSWLFNVYPNVKIQQFRPRLSWNVAYTPGFQEYDHPSSLTSTNSSLFSQRLNAGFLWQLAQRWQLQGTDFFTHSADPFDNYVTHPGTPTLNNPNPISYTPLTQYTINFAVLTLTDQLSKVDTLAFSGTANLRNTSTNNLVTSVPFYNLISYGGRASYSHKLSPRLTLGGDYSYNSLDFGHGQQRTGIQSITFTGDYLIRPNMSISGWIGPENTSTKTIVGIPIFGQIFYLTNYTNLWSTSLGANFAWQLQRNSFQVGFIRQTLDGGGITATSQTNSVTAGYRRMFTSKMDLLLGGRYYHVVSVTTANRTFNNFSFYAALNYKLAKSLSASARYSYIHQTQSSAFLIGSPTYSDNVVGVSINYTWNHPLGR